MTAHLDKSLDDLISEQRSSRPKSTVQARRTEERPRDDRKGSGYWSRGRPQQEERPAPRGGSNYWQHDDRAEDAKSWQQSRGAPPPGQRWQRGHAPPGAPRRSRAVADSEPIVTTADGWEEVAQDLEPRRQQRGDNSSSYYSDRPGRAGGGGGGGAGPQRRRGGVWDRLGQPNEYQESGYGRQQRAQLVGKEEYDPVQEDAKPKRPAYYDEHDHRDDPRASRGVRRFEPYSRGGGFGGRRGRGGRGGRMGGGGFKWKHDLYEAAAAAVADEAAADEAAEVEVGNGAAEQQQDGEDGADMQE